MEQKLIILNETNLKEINDLLEKGFNIGLTYTDIQGNIYVNLFSIKGNI